MHLPKGCYQNYYVTYNLHQYWVHPHNYHNMIFHLSLQITNTYYYHLFQNVKNIELWNQYDSTVGNRTIKGPDQPRSHAILDLHEINKHLILSWGESLDECIKEMSNFNPGVKMLCAVNCLNYGDPKYSICDLRKDLDDLAESCLNHGVPIVGGNVSLYNTTDNENNKSSIWSTPIIVLAGLI